MITDELLQNEGAEAEGAEGAEGAEVATVVADPAFGNRMWLTFPIGVHIRKQRSLTDTLRDCPIVAAGRPVQVMFTHAAKMTMEDLDVALDFIQRAHTRRAPRSPFASSCTPPTC